MFTVLEGRVDFTFRSRSRTVVAGTAINIPANSPHFFRNTSRPAVRMRAGDLAPRYATEMLA